MIDKTLTVAALNIVLPAPHDPDKYAKLWLQATKIRKTVKLRGDSGGLIGTARTYHGTKLQPYIYGELYKYADIDMTGKWLDLSTGQAAESEAVDREVQIPENLKPNLKILPYVFYPNTHRLVFVSSLDAKNNLSPGMAKSLVEQCLRQEGLLSIFGKAEITVEPDRDTLKRIFAMPRIKKFHFEVKPPNALADIERQLFNKMAEQNAQVFIQELATKDPMGLKLDNETKDLARVAQSNGFASATVVNEQDRVEVFSTTDQPFKKKIIYNQDVTIPREVLIQHGEEIVANLVIRDRENGIRQ
jgi:hypothetical protein